MNTYFFEMTDIFAGELNYCWINRFTVKSKSLRGAISKISKETGYKFKNNGIYFKAQKACVACYELDGINTSEPDQDWIDKSIKLGGEL